MQGYSLVTRHVPRIITRAQDNGHYMFEVGPSFSNPAKAVVSLLLNHPGVSVFRDRNSIEVELADLLHRHVTSIDASLQGDAQNQQKIAKALDSLRPKDGNKELTFDGISWHRLLVRESTLTPHSSKLKSCPCNYETSAHSVPVLSCCSPCSSYFSVGSLQTIQWIS